MTHHYNSTSYSRNSSLSISVNAMPSLDVSISQSVPICQVTPGLVPPLGGGGKGHGLEFTSVPNSPAQNGSVLAPAATVGLGVG